MSDATGCSNKHERREPIIVNQHYSEPGDHTKKQTINSQDFTPSDLELFVDSMETIARLRKTKYERRQKPEIKQLKEAFENAKKTITCWDSSMIFTSYDEDHNADTTNFNYNKTLYAYSLPDGGICTVQLYGINENCFSLSSMPFLNNRKFIYEPASLNYEANKFIGNKTLYSSINGNFHHNSLPSSSLTQETEAHGSYLYNSHVYEEIQPLQSQSTASPQPKSKSFISRFTSFIKKKQCLTPEASSATNMICTTSLCENAEYSEIYEHVVENVPQFRKRSKNTKKVNCLIKKKRRHYSTRTNQKCLEKTMHLLTI